MNKINYPANKKDFHDSFYKIFSPAKAVAINGHLSNILYNGAPLDFKTLITLPLEELITLKNDIENYSISRDTSTIVNGKNIILNDFKALFNYKSMQPKLADFFMNYKDLKLNTCYYCSLDHINAFIDFPDYKNGLQFVNKADKYDLQFIKGIDENIANIIIAGRNPNEYQTYSRIPVTAKILKQIKSIPYNKSHNHFTLDHLFPQNSNVYYSLCLYNLVPSCYSCNSKFKNDIEFEINNDLQFVSPTSSNYSFNKSFEFELYYAKKIEDIKTVDDFELKKKITAYETQINSYLRMFKIMGRYIPHKDEILKLIHKKLKYPESKIKELSDDTGLSQKTIRKMIFGEDLFDNQPSDKPFVKFRKDIAKNIKIRGVI